VLIEELTKAVIESGVLTEAADRYTAGMLPPLAIPTTLQASLLARLDRLAPVREVAQIAATLGRHFSHELISAVTKISQQVLNNALAQLVEAELIYRRGTPPPSLESSAGPGHGCQRASVRSRSANVQGAGRGSRGARDGA
jgi:predicted ATPase